MRFNPAAVAALAAALMVSTVAKADVVLGNLGASGTNALGNFAITGGPSTQVAFRFTTSGVVAFSELESAAFGLLGNNVPVTAELFQDSGSNAPGASLGTLGPAQTVNNTSPGSTFTFSPAAPVALASGTYWITLSSTGNFNWQFPGDFAVPTAYNSSGYASVGALTNSGTGWASFLPGVPGVSLTAVPEPSTFALAGFGIAGAGLLYRYRRSRRASV